MTDITDKIPFTELDFSVILSNTYEDKNEQLEDQENELEEIKKEVVDHIQKPNDYLENITLADLGPYPFKHKQFKKEPAPKFYAKLKKIKGKKNFENDVGDIYNGEWDPII